MNKSYLKILTVLALAISLIACDYPISSGTSTVKMVRQKSAKTMWERMSNEMQLKTHHSNPRVKRFITQYTKNNAENLIIFSGRAEPYLYHIVNVIEERAMPSELALLPIVESEYLPMATSKMGATGIWQLAAKTGKIFGLKSDNWREDRRDIEAATDVALKQLQYLADSYNGDWLLALAAYNAGPGRVGQAIAKNKRLGKPTDYWSLDLPKETMYFVPKFLALAYIVQNSKKLGVDLAPIDNKPYFTTVQLNKQIDLNKAATLAKLDVKEVKKLNPGFRTNLTHPQGPHKLILPIKNAQIFRANYVAQAPAKTVVKTQTTKSQVKPAVKSQTVNIKNAKTPVKTTQVANSSIKKHTVNSGDTLVIIAAKYKTSVKHIKNKNNLKSDIIRTGQQLVV